MVLHHHRQIGPADREGTPLQVLEHLRRSHVVDHHTVDVEQRLAAVILDKAMLGPDLVEQGRAHRAVASRTARGRCRQFFRPARQCRDSNLRHRSS